MRSILRAILAITLLLGSGIGDWALVQASAHESCCCGTPASAEETCPCPKPDSNRGPSRGTCPERQVVVATPAVLRRGVQGQRRLEPRPEPVTWAKVLDVSDLPVPPAPVRGRDPDLGQHLARLGAFRI